MNGTNPLEETFDEQSFYEAQKKAEAGEYSTTLVEQWVLTLQNHIDNHGKKVQLGMAQGLLNQWPFLSHALIPMYMDQMEDLLQEALEEIETAIAEQPKSREALFLENKMDFRLHKDLYREIIARFTALQQDWTDSWADMPWTDAKTVYHASISTAMAILAGNYGLLIELRSLAEYNWDDDVDGKVIKERIEELTADREASAKQMDDLERAVNEAETDE